MLHANYFFSVENKKEVKNKVQQTYTIQVYRQLTSQKQELRIKYHHHTIL